MQQQVNPVVKKHLHVSKKDLKAVDEVFSIEGEGDSCPDHINISVQFQPRNCWGNIIFVWFSGEIVEDYVEK